jgi:wolfamin
MDATEILQHCLATGQGISEQNFLDVQKCLKMSQDEKLARRAARQLFNRYAAVFSTFNHFKFVLV